MTLPSLVQNYKEKETVSRLKKVYSTLENAYRLAVNENTEIKNWFPAGSDSKTTSEIFYKNLKPYLKVMKECGTEPGCLTPGYVKTLDGRNYRNYDQHPNEYRIILTDGTSLMFYANYLTNTTNIKVDIDGIKKGDYTMGKDFFFFEVTSKGIVPSGNPLTTTPERTFQKYCNIGQPTEEENGYNCTAWVIYNENMDYLHCNDLSWDGKKKCK